MNREHDPGRSILDEASGERPERADPPPEDPTDSEPAQGSDFALDPAPARSDQLPEDAPEPVAPD